MKTTLRLCLALLGAMTLFNSNAQRAVDGDHTVTSAGEVVNTYTYLTSNATASSTTLTVNNNAMNGGVFTDALEQGDLILIIQMYGGTVDVNFYPSVAVPPWGPYTIPDSYFSVGWGANPETFGQMLTYENAGKFEQVEVLGTSGSNTITLTCGLKNNYTAVDNVQIVRIPRFNNLTVNAGNSISAPAWDGLTGGVVAVEVDQTLTMNAGSSITASDLGFRGGQLDPNGQSGQSGTAAADRFLGSSDPIEGSERGESIFGYHTEYDAIYSRYGIGAIANGGAGGAFQNTGGGGGTNVQIGGPAYNGHGNPVAGYAAAWALDPEVTSSSGGGQGGYALSQNSQNPLTTGPDNTAWGGDTRKTNGGWGGHPLTYDATRLFFGGGGGAGDQDSDQGGAGGRGGGIVFIVNYGSITGSGSIEANGEAGQKTNPNNEALGFSTHKGNDGAGGGGGGGAIYIENATAIPGTISINAIGGDGGDQDLQINIAQAPEAGGPGGSGSGGTISFTSGAPVQNVSAGIGGTSNSPQMVNFPPNGATQGSSGASGLSAPYYDLDSNNAIICSGQTANVSVTVLGSLPAGSTNSDITWYSSQYGNTPIGNTGLTYTTPALTTTTTYYVGLCPGTFRVPVVVTVTPGPNLVITDPAAVCAPGTVDLTDAAVTAGSDAGTLSYWTDAGATSTLATPAAVGATGTYYIELDAGGGCTVVQPVNVTVTSAPNLVITDPAAVCSPATVDITNATVTAGSDAGTLTYWTDAGATSTLATPTSVGTGTYYIQLDVAGCTSVQPVNVTVNPTPNLVITDPAAACAPSTVDITAAAVTVGSDAGTLTYWTDAGATSTLATPNAVATSGTYYIQLDVGGCTSIQPVNVTVTSSPTLIITDPVGVCAPSTVDITAAAVTAGSDVGTLTYWTDAGATSTLATPTSVGNGTYYIQLDIGGGCTTVEPVNVSVSAVPTLTITDPAAVCAPGTVDLTTPAVTAGSDAGTLTYWTDAGATATLSTPAVVNTSGTYYIQLDVSGCTVVQPVNVTINTQPNLVVTDPAAECAPATIDITTASVTAGSDAGTLTYWTDAGATSTLATPTTVGNGTYYIQLEDANTCTSVVAVNATVNAQPNLVVTDPATICSSNTTDLTVPAITAGSDAGTLTYWTDASATATLTTPTAVSGTATYYIVLDDGNCTDTAAVNTTSIAAPVASFTAVPTTGCAVPHTVFFTDWSTMPDTWAWDFGDASTSTLQNPVHNYTTYNTFTVTLTVTDTITGCTDSATETITVTTPPVLNAIAPLVACDSVQLPAITGTNLTTAEAYYTGTGGTGTAYAAGDWITSSTTLYAYDGACSNEQTVTVTVNAQPNLMITNPAAVCAPGTVDLTNATVTAGSDAGTLTYWTDAGATATLATPGAVTTGTYYIQLEDANTCTVVQSVDATINAIPNLTITDPAAVCSPSTVDITQGAVTTGSDAGTLTYWTDAGATATLGSPTTATNGMYYIQLEDANSCTSVQAVNVTVNALPNLSVTDPAGVCSPGTVDITGAAVTAGSDPGTLTYWTDAGATTALASPTAVGAGTFYIQLEDANTCTSITAVNTTVNPLPSLVITDPAAVCTPGTVDVTDVAVTAGSDPGTLTYWTDAGATATLATPGAVGASGTYYVQLEDANTCTSIEAVNVTITNTPNLVITDPTAVCDPSTVDLTDAGVTVGSDAGTLTYWTDAGATSTLATPTGVGAGVYYIQLDLGAGCSTIEQVNVTVNPLPNLIVTDPTAVCDPNSVDLTDAAVTAGSDAGTLSYWTDAGATTPITTPAAVATGTFYIQLTDANNCSSVAAVNTIVNPLDDPAFTLTATCDGATASVIGLTGGTFTFQVVPMDGAIIDGTTGTITGGDYNSVYDVLYTTNGTCPNSSVEQVIVNDCTPEDVTIPSAITPDNDLVNDSWEILNLDNLYPDNRVIVYNRWGNVVFEHQSSAASPYSSNQWDGTFNGKPLPVASYYYIIETNGGNNESFKGSVSIILND